MKKDDYLKAILLFAVFGMLFSGYLSYGEFFPSASSGTTCAALSAKIFGLPTCVYGFAMYAIVAVLALLAINGKK
ncbi:Uncharacterised protein [Candidatus Norongarragalina meridionalis]|nr:Uncharacterised protein [Candidatus Norongarragalina meridionalis]